MSKELTCNQEGGCGSCVPWLTPDGGATHLAGETPAAGGGGRGYRLGRGSSGRAKKWGWGIAGIVGGCF